MAWHLVGARAPHWPAMTKEPALSAARPKFQAFQPGCDAEADLALHTQRLQRDRVVGTADQRVTADPDANRSTTLCAGVIAGEIAGPEPGDRGVDAPRQRRFLGDADIDADLADGRNVTILRHTLNAQHATEIGHRTDDESDTRAAAAFENADLNALDWLLRAGAGARCNQRSEDGPGKDE